MDIISFAAGAAVGYMVCNLVWRWFTGAALKNVAKCILDFNKRLEDIERVC